MKLREAIDKQLIVNWREFVLKNYRLAFIGPVEDKKKWKPGLQTYIDKMLLSIDNQSITINN